MKKLLPLVILLSIGITQIYAQNCFNCDSTTKAFTIGNATTASGLASFAGGNASNALGQFSFTFGNNAEVMGNNGIALGNNAKVNDFKNSIALGSFVTSNEANSLVFGTGSSGSPLINSKPNSIMFGVSNFPSLTIVKPLHADMGYLGIGTEEPEEMVHVVGKLLIDRTNETESSLQFKHPKARGVGTDPGEPQLAPSYWDIYSDSYGLKFNTVNYGQNPVLSQKIVITSGGFVGIGTDVPRARLHVAQNILSGGNIITLDKFVLQPAHNSTSEYWEISRTNTGLSYGYKDGILRNVLFLGNDGFIGVGKANPEVALDVNGAFRSGSATVTRDLSAHNATIAGTLSANVLNTQDATIEGTLTANSLTIDSIFSADNATITGALSANSATIAGTLSASLLKVPNAQINGMLCAKEVKVQNALCWPDYVFNKDYNLLPLVELEQFISENQHLPNVPSAAEVEANGIELGKMNAVLLQKVEELTLYIIQMEKRLAELESTKGGK